MHPAYSIIVFTTASGAGYGLLALLGIAAPAGLAPSSGWFAAAGIGLALALVSAGLLSSLLHLGHPERAWRALTQVGTSWLSREGVLAVLTYFPALLFAFGWVVLGRRDGFFAGTGLATTILSLLTVMATGMIYASLKPIRQWHNVYVVPVYLMLGLMTGALWLNGFVLAWGHGGRAIGVFTTATVVAAVMLKERYWRAIDAGEAASTPETATGLVGRGQVRLLDPPHTVENYLQQEMGFAIARKHAIKLRRIALALAFALPLALTLATLVTSGVVAALLAFVSAVSGMLGVLIERWLFFAEAKHTVMLYYGASRV